MAVFLSYFSTFITGYIIAFTRSWKLALVVMTMLPLIALIGATLSKVKIVNVYLDWEFYLSVCGTPQIIASFAAREQGAYAAAGAVAEEVLSSIRTVVAFGGENKEAVR